MFLLYNKEYLPVGTLRNLKDDVVNLYIGDIKNRIGKFTAFGQEAEKFKKYENGMVSHIKST